MKRFVYYVLLMMLCMGSVLLSGCGSKDKEGSPAQTTEVIVDVESSAGAGSEEQEPQGSESGLSGSEENAVEDTTPGSMDVDEEIEIEIGSDEEVDGF